MTDAGARRRRFRLVWCSTRSDVGWRSQETPDRHATEVSGVQPQVCLCARNVPRPTRKISERPLDAYLQQDEELLTPRNGKRNEKTGRSNPCCFCGCAAPAGSPINLWIGGCV